MNYVFISWDDLLANYDSYVDLLYDWVGLGIAEETNVGGQEGFRIYINSTTDTDGNGTVDFLDTNAQGGYTPSQFHGGT